MHKKLIPLVCPKCGNSEYVVKDKVVLGQIESDIKNSILNKKYFTNKCSKCSFTNIFTFPFIYYDAINKYAICNDIEDVKLNDDVIIYKATNYKQIINYIQVLDNKINLKILDTINDISFDAVIIDISDDIVIEVNNQIKILRNIN